VLNRSCRCIDKTDLKVLNFSFAKTIATPTFTAVGRDTDPGPTFVRGMPALDLAAPVSRKGHDHERRETSRIANIFGLDSLSAFGGCGVDEAKASRQRRCGGGRQQRQSRRRVNF
jgi:hypothetical protein